MKREGFGPLFFVFTIIPCGIPARVHSFGIPAPVPSNSVHSPFNPLISCTTIPHHHHPSTKVEPYPCIPKSS